MRRKTTRVRVPSNIVEELKVKFPGARMPDLFNVMYNTSLLKAEAKLRYGKKKIR